MGTHTVTRDLFFLSVLFVAGISCFTIFRSCDDVKKGSDPPVTQDGEYPIFIKEKLVTVIYCAGMYIKYIYTVLIKVSGHHMLSHNKKKFNKEVFTTL